jgi:ubiquinone/menaquinone biosynthesis C-methylase UbiE
MNIAKWFFAEWYDILNLLVEDKIIPYRKETATLCYGKVLEIGGGTGANLPYFNKDCQITILEPDKFMRRKLNKKALRQSLNIKVIDDFGENISLKDNSVDSVLCTLVLCMVNDVDKVISEIYRVLKPEGKFYFYEHVIASSGKGIVLQTALNPIWKWVTTGCNLKNNTINHINNHPFKNVEYRQFGMYVRIPISIPNIVGVAIK